MPQPGTEIDSGSTTPSAHAMLRNGFTVEQFTLATLELGLRGLNRLGRIIREPSTRPARLAGFTCHFAYKRQ
jgi:hypothetical protein